MTHRLRIAVAVAVLATAFSVQGSAAAERHGSFWCALDNVREVAADGRVLLWVALPTARPEQDVTITAIEPEPAGVVEDPRTGNRVVEWVLQPDPREILPEQAPEQFYFHFTFDWTEKPVRRGGDAAAGDYDHASEAYRRWTASEIWLQTDGAVYDRARQVVRDESDPVRAGRLLFDWVVANVEFVSGGTPERDARSVLEAGGGDCSQMSVLFCALCRSVGIPARTVTRAWLTGGFHTFAEIMLPDGGWLPVDPSLGRLTASSAEDAPGKRAALALTLAENPAGDPGWFFGNMPAGRLTVSVGNNIRIASPTLGRTVEFRDLRPGGRYAHPAAIEITGLNDDIVHGGFFVFDRDVDAPEAAHALVHERLGHLFFRTDVFASMDAGCLEPVSRYGEPVQNWLNQGKVYMHKGEYYRAEASFKRALMHESSAPAETVAWLHNYLGNCYDLLGRRELALAQYEAAVALGVDFDGSLAYARRWLKRPFDRNPAGAPDGD